MRRDIYRCAGKRESCIESKNDIYLWTNFEHQNGSI
jgi:hypothetical protein